MKDFNTSDYPRDNNFIILLVNMEILVMMKNKNNGVIMKEITGLLYALKSKTFQNKCDILGKKLETEEYEIHQITVNMDITKKSKGVKENIIKKKTNISTICR